INADKTKSKDKRVLVLSAFIGVYRRPLLSSCHSPRNTTAGSTTAAFLAGPKLASPAATPSPITTAMYVHGSAAFTPYSSEIKYRLRNSAHPTPTAAPAVTNAADSFIRSE